MLTGIEKRLISSIDKNELIELTRELVRIDSVIRPETGNTEHKVVEYIKNWLFKELSVQCTVDQVSPGRENIIAVIDSGEKGPCLMLEGHSDVVSEGDPSRWKHAPFGAEIEDGKIYGRGACDMKAGLAVNLLTAKAFKQAGISFKGKIKLGIVCDEEGMMAGIKDFIKKGYADDVDACLIPEPEENQLCLSMKGALRALVKVKGKMAHGAMPLNGINPNPRMARIILAYEEFEDAEKKRCGKDELLGFPSITFTVVQAPPPGSPAQLNVIPGEAIGYVDVRTTPAQNHHQIREKLKTILTELKTRDQDFKGEIEFIEERPLVSIDKDEPIVLATAQSYLDITGKKPVYNGVPGATDGTFLTAWKNIPSLVVGPGARHIPHQIDEYVEIEELYEAARVYILSAFRFLK
ncbi:MAG: M20 family metallopeptidase [Spirochaetota bacterium]